MNYRKMGLILLALLLAGLAMVPIVSAEQNSASDSVFSKEDIISENFIPIETVRDHAIVKIAESVETGMLDGAWNDAIISEEPLIIYDINGERLFYQFTVEKNGKKTGDVLSSANKILGISVKQFSEPGAYDLVSRENLAEKVTRDNYPEYSVESTKIVCYNYPNMGVMVHLINPDTQEEKSYLYDADSLQIVSLEKTSRDNELSAWSYYEDIPESTYQEQIAQWEREADSLNKIADSANAKGVSIREIIADQKPQSMMIAASYPSGCTETYCEMPKGFPTIDQGSNGWCQAATAWVITKFYHPSNSRTLANVASTMQADPVIGATWSNELNYYTSSYLGGAASGGLGKTNSYYRTTNPSLTYEIIRTEILGQRPLKVGYNGHSRACIGYSRNSGGDTYYKFSNSQLGGYLQWEAAPNPYGSITGYQTYIIVN
jgi:hypothetical protein